MENCQLLLWTGLDCQLTFAAPVKHNLACSRSVDEEVQERSDTRNREQNSGGAILDERHRTIWRESGDSQNEVQRLELEVDGEQTSLKGYESRPRQYPVGYLDHDEGLIDTQAKKCRVREQVVRSQVCHT